MSSSCFRHGVASFDPDATSVLLWTRVDAPGTVEWRIARDPDLTDLVDSGTAQADDAHDRCVTVTVDGLEPATTYFFDFARSGERSPVGRTRTVADAPVDRLRLGIACCADYSAAPLGVYRALAEREVDVVVHLGDYIYEAQTANSGRRAKFATTCTTLEDYRSRYAQIREDPDVQYLHARHPMVTIWDDHDLADNAWRTGAKAHDPDEHGDWDERVGAAAAARAEWLPIRYREPDDLRRTWRSVVIGDLAEIVLLDTRYEGRDRQADDEGTLPRDHPDRSLLGDDQRAFVGERLADTQRPWTLLASGVVVNEIALPMSGGGLLPTGLLPNGYALIDGKLLHDDQWDGYTAERDWLTDRLEARADAGARTVLLSGDVHSCWAMEGPEGTTGPVAVEAVCPATSSAAMGRANVAGVNRLVDRAARQMSHVPWANVTERGYTICDVDRTRAQLEWWIADPYALDPGADAECIAVKALRHDRWPCRLDDVDQPSSDPERPDIPVVPDRPDDLHVLRLKRFGRLFGKGTLLSALAVATGAGLGMLSRRRRRARRRPGGR